MPVTRPNGTMGRDEQVKYHEVKSFAYRRTLSSQMELWKKKIETHKAGETHVASRLDELLHLLHPLNDEEFKDDYLNHAMKKTMQKYEHANDIIEELHHITRPSQATHRSQRSPHPNADADSGPASTQPAKYSEQLESA